LPVQGGQDRAEAACEFDVAGAQRGRRSPPDQCVGAAEHDGADDRADREGLVWTTCRGERECDAENRIGRVGEDIGESQDGEIHRRQRHGQPRQ
jgi:hypothetical protein